MKKKENVVNDTQRIYELEDQVAKLEERLLLVVKTLNTITYSDEEKADGFLHEGIWITDPTASEDMRFDVDPEEYYGEAYAAYKRKKVMS
jgi:hypothetical protein